MIQTSLTMLPLQPSLWSSPDLLYLQTCSADCCHWQPPHKKHVMDKRNLPPHVRLEQGPMSGDLPQHWSNCIYHPWMGCLPPTENMILVPLILPLVSTPVALTVAGSPCCQEHRLRKLYEKTVLPNFHLDDTFRKNPSSQTSALMRFPKISIDTCAKMKR